jgi:RNA methyltransferase, TrmH family
MKPPKILRRSGAQRGRGARSFDDSGLQPRVAAKAESERAESGVWRSGQSSFSERKPKRAEGEGAYGDKPRRSAYGGSAQGASAYKPKRDAQTSTGQSYGSYRAKRDDAGTGGSYRGKQGSAEYKKSYRDDQAGESGEKPWRSFAKEVASAGTGYARKPKREFSADRKPYSDRPQRSGDAGQSRKPWQAQDQSGASAAGERPKFASRTDYAQGGDARPAYKARLDARPEKSAEKSAENRPEKRLEKRPEKRPEKFNERPYAQRTDAASGASAGTSSAWTARARSADSSARSREVAIAKQESFDRPKRSALSREIAPSDALDDDDIADMELVDARPDYLPRRGDAGKAGIERHPALAQRGREIRIYGRHAVLAVFRQRPDAIRKLYYTRAAQAGLGDMLSYLAASQVSYREVTPEELVKIASSEHHEGLVAEIVRPTPLEFSALKQHLSALQRATVVLLDGVSNPHNFGAMLRICAHFGADAVLLAPKHGQDEMDPNELPLSGAMYRVAEGGAEATPILRLNSLTQLDDIRALGFEAVAAHPHDASSIYSAALPKKLLLMLGAEGAGLSPAMLSFASRRLSIPGSGKVESLNVAQAAAVLLAEVSRQRS